MSSALIDLLSENDKVFVMNDGIWSIKYFDEEVIVKDIKGARYIHYLLSNPHRHLSFPELYVGVNGGDIKELQSIVEGHDFEIDGNYDDILESLRKEKSRIKNEIESLKPSNKTNAQKIKKLKEKIVFIEDEIKKLVRLQYHGVRYSAEGERLRSAIRMATSNFYKKLEKHEVEKLLRYFKSQIQVRYGYTYVPKDGSDEWVLFS